MWSMGRRVLRRAHLFIPALPILSSNQLPYARSAGDYTKGYQRGGRSALHAAARSGTDSTALLQRSLKICCNFLLGRAVTARRSQIVVVTKKVQGSSAFNPSAHRLQISRHHYLTSSSLLKRLTVNSQEGRKTARFVQGGRRKLHVAVSSLAAWRPPPSPPLTDTLVT